MKTIEKAAEEYAKGLNYSLEAKHNMCQEDFIFAFMKGAKFTQKFIPISEEFPPEDGAIIFKFTKNVEKVHCKLGWCCCGIILLDNGDSLFPKQLDFYGIEWRPINYK